VAFLLFAVVAAVTPGPSNIMLTAAGAHAGVRKGLPCLCGVTTGVGVMMFLVPLGLRSLVLQHPLALKTLNWGGVNRRWETSWKWIRHDTRDLALKPDRLIERIEHVFSAAVPHQRRLECNSLILDTLLLVPKPYDVSEAIATIRESLRTHSR